MEKSDVNTKPAIRNVTVSLRRLLGPSYGRLILSGIVGLLIGFGAGRIEGDLPIPKQPELPSMTECVAGTLTLLGQKSFQTSETLRDARDHCYSLIQSQGLLGDFTMRKLNYIQQYRANGVLMWMVVIITFSGVLLAGLQLWASYRLAESRQTTLDANDGQLVLERDRVVLKSSIAGLFILLVSFAFFLVFVLYVYRFEHISDQANSDALPVTVHSTDGLGPPPTKSGQ